MSRIKIFFFLSVITISFWFIYTIFNIYISEQHQNKILFNRNISEEKILKNPDDLIILKNDTNEVIIFNNDLETEINSKKKRSFWSIFKSGE